MLLFYYFASDQNIILGFLLVDFRSPEPADVHRRTLRLLRKLKELEPAMMKVNGEQFDYVSPSHPPPSSTSVDKLG